MLFSIRNKLFQTLIYVAFYAKKKMPFQRYFAVKISTISHSPHPFHNFLGCIEETGIENHNLSIVNDEAGNEHVFKVKIRKMLLQKGYLERKRRQYRYST